MQLISTHQYQALEQYLDAVAHHAKQRSILEQYQHTPLADLAGWQEAQVNIAAQRMQSEQAKLDAACSGDYRQLFQDVLISSLLSRKLGGGPLQ